MPTHASFLYSRNVINLLALFTKEGRVQPDWKDEIVIGTTVLQQATPSRPPPPRRSASRSPNWTSRHTRTGGRRMTGGILEYVTVFVLAGFVGVEVISQVPSLLHTPLMSGPTPSTV